MKPQHKHDCESCTFLGFGLRNWGYGGLQLGSHPDPGMGADLYLSHEGDSILIRTGSEPGEYGSYPINIAKILVATGIDGTPRIEADMLRTNLAIALGYLSAMSSTAPIRVVCQNTIQIGESK